MRSHGARDLEGNDELLGVDEGSEVGDEQGIEDAPIGL